VHEPDGLEIVSKYVAGETDPRRCNRPARTRLDRCYARHERLRGLLIALRGKSMGNALLATDAYSVSTPVNSWGLVPQTPVSLTVTAYEPVGMIVEPVVALTNAFGP
jgi:hypothetical protein